MFCPVVLLYYFILFLFIIIIITIIIIIIIIITNVSFLFCCLFVFKHLYMCVGVHACFVSLFFVSLQKWNPLRISITF